MVPETSISSPACISQGTELAFTVRVLTSGLKITVVSLVIGFDPELLEVVQIQAHPNNPLNLFSIGGQANNEAGTFEFTVGAREPATTDFDVAIITFRALDQATEPGVPTEVVFLVDEDNETSVFKGKILLLANESDFTGAFLEVRPPGECPEPQD